MFGVFFFPLPFPITSQVWGKRHPWGVSGCVQSWCRREGRPFVQAHCRPCRKPRGHLACAGKFYSAELAMVVLYVVCVAKILAVKEWRLVGVRARPGYV